jgi:UDP-N-acetylmuramoylalanine--D-glutamate ligase
VLGQVAGVPVGAMRKVVTSFPGVEHRLELVGEIRGAKWYNDSIATAPERSLAAIRSFDDPIVLLAGGRDKNLPWDEFAIEVRRRVRRLITFGEAGPMIARLVNGQAPKRHGSRDARSGSELEGVTQTETLEEAVAVAAGLARAGDVVLLSPGGTSFDAYRDFAERGDRFGDIVRSL